MALGRRAHFLLCTLCSVVVLSLIPGLIAAKFVIEVFAFLLKHTGLCPPFSCPLWAFKMKVAIWPSRAEIKQWPNRTGINITEATVGHGLHIYLSIYPSIHLSIYPSIHLSIYPSIHLSIYLSIYI